MRVIKLAGGNLFWFEVEPTPSRQRTAPVHCGIQPGPRVLSGTTHPQAPITLNLNVSHAPEDEVQSHASSKGSVGVKRERDEGTADGMAWSIREVTGHESAAVKRMMLSHHNEGVSQQHTSQPGINQHHVSEAEMELRAKAWANRPRSFAKLA